MTSARNIGRIIGLLVLAHLATGLIVPYVLLHPLSTAPGFLEKAAGMEDVRATVRAVAAGRRGPGALPEAIA